MLGNAENSGNMSSKMGKLWTNSSLRWRKKLSQSGEVLEKLLPMDMFVTTGMGDRLREKLKNIGVHVIVTDEIDPDNFINSLL